MVSFSFLFLFLFLFFSFSFSLFSFSLFSFSLFSFSLFSFSLFSFSFLFSLSSFFYLFLFILIYLFFLLDELRTSNPSPVRTPLLPLRPLVVPRKNFLGPPGVVGSYRIPENVNPGTNSPFTQKKFSSGDIVHISSAHRAEGENWVNF